MKKTTLLLPGCLLFAALLMASCVGKKAEQPQSPEADKEAFRSTLTAADTTAVMQLSEKCMQNLKSGEMDEALDMLYTLQDSLTAVPLSEEQKNQLRNKFRLFPVKDYRLERFTFATENSNDVKYAIVFDEQDPAGKIGLMFNPVKLKGTWFLTLKESGQELN